MTDSSVAQSFEQALAELEALVAKMEGGQLTLEESLMAHRRGADLLRYCQNTLENAEQQVRILEGELMRAFDGGEDAGE